MTPTYRVTAMVRSVGRTRLRYVVEGNRGDGVWLRLGAFKVLADAEQCGKAFVAMRRKRDAKRWRPA